MKGNQLSQSELTVKWLRVLMYIGVVSLLNTILNFLPIIPSAVTTWVSRGVLAVTIYAMLQMAPLHERYQKAGIFRAVMIACTLVSAIVDASSLITLAVSIFSILAVYQEYSAHSALTANLDPELSRKWHSLFNWGILASILVSFGSFIAVMIISMTEAAAALVPSLIVGLLSIPQIVIDVVYLKYLKKMTSLLRTDWAVGDRIGQ